jgi:hypothetical protein
MVAHTCNPSTGIKWEDGECEAKLDYITSLKPANSVVGILPDE